MHVRTEHNTWAQGHILRAVEFKIAAAAEAF